MAQQLATRAAPAVGPMTGRLAVRAVALAAMRTCMRVAVFAGAQRLAEGVALRGFVTARREVARLERAVDLIGGGCRRCWGVHPGTLGHGVEILWLWVS